MNNDLKIITIATSRYGDRSILKYGDDFETSGHSLSKWDWLMLLRQLGYEVDMIEVSNEEMEAIQVKKING